MNKKKSAVEVANEFLANGASDELPHDVQAGIRASAAMASMYMLNLVMGGFSREEAVVLTCTWIKTMMEINKK